MEQQLEWFDDEGKKFNLVHATIQSMGDIQQVSPKYSKFGFEYTEGDNAAVYSAESPHWHKSLLQIGKTYELTLKANPTNDGGFFPGSIDGKPVLVTEQAANGARPNPPATPAKKPAPAPAPVVAQQQTPAPGRRPELNARWVQFSTHFRTAQMQATERVGQMIQLAIAGRLITEGDEPVKSLKQSTIEEWYAKEVTRYVEDLGQVEPADWFGNMRDGS